MWNPVQKHTVFGGDGSQLCFHELCVPEESPTLSLLVRPRGVRGHHSIRATHNVDIVQESANCFPLEQLTLHNFERKVLTEGEQRWHQHIPLFPTFPGCRGGCLLHLARCTLKGTRRIVGRTATPCQLPPHATNPEAWTHKTPNRMLG